MNGFMFDNYRYAVSSAKLQPLSEHSKIDLESGKLGIIKYSNRLCLIRTCFYVVQNLRRAPRRCLKPNRWPVSTYCIIYIYSKSPHRKVMDRNDLSAFSGTAVNMLLAFSVRRNLRQICDKSIGEDTISTVHGLRSLSMVWIVLGHVCIVSFKYSGNYLQLIIIRRSSLITTYIRYNTSLTLIIQQ